MSEEAAGYEVPDAELAVQDVLTEADLERCWDAATIIAADGLVTMERAFDEALSARAVLAAIRSLLRDQTH